MTTSFERRTFTLPAEMAVIFKQAVEDGAYTSTSAIVQEALHQWEPRRQVKRHVLPAFKADIGHR